MDDNFRGRDDGDYKIDWSEKMDKTGDLKREPGAEAPGVDKLARAGYATVAKNAGLELDQDQAPVRQINALVDAAL